MLYRFKSAAAADLIMLREHGDALLGLIGKPVAAQGIVTVQELPSAIGALDTAMGGGDPESPARDADEIPLRRRAWPLMEMLRSARAAAVPVVWGV